MHQILFLFVGLSICKLVIETILELLNKSAYENPDKQRQEYQGFRKIGKEAWEEASGEKLEKK